MDPIPNEQKHLEDALERISDSTNFELIASSARALFKAGLKRYAVELLRRAVRKSPAVLKTETFMTLAYGPIGQFIMRGEMFYE